MGEIKLDAHNYRIHDERNLKLIKKSLKECGAARSIAIDADGEIIAGNATYKTAQELGIPVKIIETDGNRVPFAHIVKVAKQYIDKIGGFEKLAEWGLREV